MSFSLLVRATLGSFRFLYSVSMGREDAPTSVDQDTSRGFTRPSRDISRDDCGQRYYSKGREAQCCNDCMDVGSPKRSRSFGDFKLQTCDLETISESDDTDSAFSEDLFTAGAPLYDDDAQYYDATSSEKYSARRASFCLDAEARRWSPRRYRSRRIAMRRKSSSACPYEPPSERTSALLRQEGQRLRSVDSTWAERVTSLFYVLYLTSLVDVYKIISQRLASQSFSVWVTACVTVALAWTLAAAVVCIIVTQSLMFLLSLVISSARFFFLLFACLATVLTLALVTSYHFSGPDGLGEKFQQN